MKRTSSTSTPLPAPLDDKVREAAYFEWLNHGCPHGDDWSHWFAAENNIVVGLDAPVVVPDEPAANATKFALEANFAAHSSDPLHRFHGPGTAHDDRTDIIASGARQRVRGRHFGGSLRPPQKSPK